MRSSEITVVIPLYNKEAEIERAVRSVLGQRTLPHEVIVVDDGSTDRSAEIVARIDHPLIRLIRQQNRGVSAARNRGMEEASTPWVALLDGDDTWREGYLEEICRLAERYPDCGAYATGFDILNGEELTPANCPTSEGVVDFFREAMRRYILIPSTTTLNREVALSLGGFPEGMRMGEDQYLWTRLNRTAQTAFSPKREVIYSRRRNALYGERIEIDLNNIMYDYAGDFADRNEGAEYEDFKFELIREVAVEPSFDAAAYGKFKRDELLDAIVKDIKATTARRAKAVADTVRSTMERIYEDRKDQLDMKMYFPMTNGHLGYNIPVELRKCKETDGAEIYRVFSKVVMFTTIYDAWREHLREMDDLRTSVQNATYEQKDPLLIYKFESFGLFQKMLTKVNRDTLAILCKAYIPVNDQRAESAAQRQQQRAKVDVNKLQASRMQAAAQAGQAEKSKPMPIHVEKKVGRNDPCPCGSGKKYKNCCMLKEQQQ